MESFPLTQWTIILAATVHGDTVASRAWGEFHRRYERVLHSIIRRWTGPEGAEETLQGFLHYLMDTSALRKADPERGRFRSFLRVLLKHYLLGERERDGAIKRGGKVVFVPLDGECPDPPSEEWADDVFDKEWAFGIFEEAVRVVERRWSGERFDVLRGFLPGATGRPRLEEAAERLGISVAAVDSAVSRMRRLWAECVRAEVARTVDRPDEIGAEVDFLCRCIAHWSEKSLTDKAANSQSV
jgi:DNA-directed RNA polymerase specialized sigma24 family protein